MSRSASSRQLAHVSAQLVDLGIPYAAGEQGQFLGKGIAAVALTTDEPGDPPIPLGDPGTSLSVDRLGEMGRATESLVGSIDLSVGAAFRTPDTIFFGDRVASGWALRLTLLVAVAPFALGVLDLLVRSRRRRLPLRPAARALRTRAFVWMCAGLLLWFAGFAGILPTGAPLPVPPYSSFVTDWSFAGLALLGIAFAVIWGIGRRQLVAPHRATAEERLAGYTIALTWLAALAIVLGLVKPYALVFILPSLYAWLWLPLRAHFWARAILFGAGLLGPLIGLQILSSELGLSARPHLDLSRRALDHRLRVVDDRGVRPGVGHCRRAARRPGAESVFAVCGRCRTAPARTGSQRRRLRLEQPETRLREREIANGSARWDLAVATRNVDESVRRRGVHDHVRLLTGDGLEESVAILDRLPRSSELVSLRVATNGASRRTDAGRRAPGSVAPCRAMRAGATKTSDATSDDTGFPGRPKTNVSPRTPNDNGFPGFIATPQKSSSTPSSDSIRRTRSCGPIDTPPDVTRTSAVEPALERGTVRAHVVGNRGEDFDLGTRTARAPRRSSDGSTRRSRPGASCSPGARSSLPVASTATRGRRVLTTCATPAAASAPIWAAPSLRPASTTRSPARTSPPLGRTCAPASGRSAISTCPSCSTAISTGTIASAPSGTTPPVAIAAAVPCPSSAGAGLPAATRTVIGKTAWSVLRPDGVAVHRRAPERREIDERSRRLGENPPCRMLERDRFGSKAPRAIEDARERLVDRQKLAHCAPRSGSARLPRCGRPLGRPPGGRRLAGAGRLLGGRRPVALVRRVAVGSVVRVVRKRVSATREGLPRRPVLRLREWRLGSCPRALPT